jgi:hypothetical protein
MSSYQLIVCVLGRNFGSGIATELGQLNDGTAKLQRLIYMRIYIVHGYAQNIYSHVSCIYRCIILDTYGKVKSHEIRRHRDYLSRASIGHESAFQAQLIVPFC